MTREAIAHFYRERFNLVLISIITILVCLAWYNRFIQDDAFISFRYAENLATGHGLVWNVGERVEGYTNFLWTILMTIPFYLGMDPVPFSLGLGLVFFPLTLFFTWRLALIILGSKDAGLLAIVLLGTNYTFSSYATGGLETQMQACLFVVCLYVAVICMKDGGANIFFAILSVLLAIAVLTRPDSAILVAVLCLTVIYSIVKSESRFSAKTGRLLALIIPLAVIMTVYVAWKLAYYGDILPNTFYAKAATAPPLKWGIFYLYVFMLSYLFAPILLFGLAGIGQMLRERNQGLLLCIGLTALWLAYVVKVGGDFMEFRFMAPVLPLIIIAVTWLVLNGTRDVRVRVVLVALVLAGSLHHAITYRKVLDYDKDNYVESVRDLRLHLEDEGGDWDGIGLLLGRTFNYSPDVTIATTAAGAIPFYAKLKTVDMLGLNDRWVAKHGVVDDPRPGHMRLAPIAYLSEKKVNLVLGHPWIVPNGPADHSRYSLKTLGKFTRLAKGDSVPADAMIVEMPVNRERALVMLYLTRSPLVDDMIVLYGWQVYPVANLYF